MGNPKHPCKSEQKVHYAANIAMVASSSPPNNIVTGPYHDDIGVDQNRTLCQRPDASRQNVSPRFQVRQVRRGPRTTG